MPFRRKIQPISGDVVAEALASTPAPRQVRKSLLTKLFERHSIPKNVPSGDPPLPRDYSIEFEPKASTPVVRQVQKSLLVKLFERQSTLKNTPDEDPPLSRDNSREFEPSYVGLRNMVENYIEDPINEKKKQRSGSLKMFYCLSGSGTNNFDEETFDEEPSDKETSDKEPSYEESSDEEIERIKGLVRCTSSHERNLVRNATLVVEKTYMCLNKDESRLQILTDALITLGYDASICISCCDDLQPINSLAGEFKYLEVLIGGERLLIDIDFKSKFEIARPTKTYKKVLQSLPCVFVGKIDRLVKLVIVVSDAAKQSFKKSKHHVAPWRKAEYVLTQWLSPYIHQGRQTTGEGSRRNQTNPPYIG